MVIGAAEPVQEQRMHKVDEHGVGGKNADGFIEEVGEGTPLSHLAVTALPEESLILASPFGRGVICAEGK